jgi:hypothetical protein
MTFRIFTNDRGTVAGVPKYSCLREVHADTPKEAVSHVDPSLGPPNHAPIKAIEWPPQTRASRNWLASYV